VARTRPRVSRGATSCLSVAPAISIELLLTPPSTYQAPTATGDEANPAPSTATPVAVSLTITIKTRVRRVQRLCATIGTASTVPTIQQALTTP
jgi:hypothetical protein